MYPMYCPLSYHTRSPRNNALTTLQLSAQRCPNAYYYLRKDGTLQLPAGDYFNLTPANGSKPAEVYHMIGFPLENFSADNPLAGIQVT